ncbi:MAG: hypothetical protein ABR570_06590 [Burkholderiales bacterium]
MAAILAMLWYAPVVLALALILSLLGITLHAFFSFGGWLNLYAGVLAWCLIALSAGLAHALLAFPWSAMQGFPLQRKK